MCEPNAEDTCSGQLSGAGCLGFLVLACNHAEGRASLLQAFSLTNPLSLALQILQA